MLVDNGDDGTSNDKDEKDLGMNMIWLFFLVYYN